MITRTVTSLYVAASDEDTPRFETSTLPALPPSLVLPGEIRVSATFTAPDAAAAAWFRDLAAVAEQAAAWHDEQAAAATAHPDVCHGCEYCHRGHKTTGGAQ